MGAPPERVMVLGNMKYDAEVPAGGLDPALGELLARWQPLVVAASTADGEDAPLLEAFSKLRRRVPGARLLIAPRRPEQFPRTARALEASGLGWSRRTALGARDPGPPGPVLLLDTVGELSRVYEFAATVFMGGTLVPRGGHNILEAIGFGKPVLFGPHMENFRDMAREFLEAGAAVEVRTSAALAGELERLLTDSAAAEEIGRRGQALLERNRGATGRVLAALGKELRLAPDLTVES
jgi:3-deoxy-D-manno-octulosonic-acid transferase